MKKFWRNNNLSIVLFSFFFVFLVGLVISGYHYENEQRQEHGQLAINVGEYLTSGAFYEAVFENWESEFLQMGALVVLTIWLVQKGAPDSRKLRGDEEVDTRSRYSIIRSHGTQQKIRAMGHAIYANSLSIALFGLFGLSFILHAFSGLSMINEEAAWHGGSVMTLG